MTAYRLTPDSDISSFASSDITRPNLMGIHYRPEGVLEATNGHFAVRVPLANSVAHPAAAGATSPTSPMTFQASAVAAAVKALPKGDALTRSAALDDGNPPLAISSTGHTALPTTVDGGAFPNVPQVILTGEPAASIGLSLDYLKQIVTYLAKHHPEGKRGMVRLDLYPDRDGKDPGKVSPLAPVVFRAPVGEDRREAQVLLMPMRL